MEQFYVSSGFADAPPLVQLPPNVPMNTRNISQLSTARQKPDLAIEVAMEAGRRGIDAVPPLPERCSRVVGWRRAINV